jgi:hypothetical protein
VNTNSEISYVWHYVSSFARGFFTAGGIVMCSAYFVSTVGAKHYSALAFNSTFFAALLYILFLSLNRRGVVVVYTGVVFMALGASLLFFRDPTHVLLLKVSASLFLVVDLIGINVVSTGLQLRVNPLIFGQIYQKIVSFELVGRVASAALVSWLGSHYELSQICPFLWLLIAGHLFCFLKTDFFQSNTITLPATPILSSQPTEIGVQAEKSELSPLERLFQNLKESIGFIFSNPVVKGALIALIWSRVAKFLVDYVYFQVITEQATSANKIGLIESMISTGGIFLTLIFQLTLGKRILSRLSLSGLLGFLPFGVLLLASMIFIVKPYALTILLVVFFQCSFRVIHFPAIRQCLLPVPKRLSAPLFSLVILLSLITSVLTSGVANQLKNIFGISEFLIILIIISGLLFLILSNLDSYYVWNFWNFYRESTTEKWSDFKWSDQPTLFDTSSVLAQQEPKDEHKPSFGSRNKVLQAYRQAHDSEGLKLAVLEHQGAFDSDRVADVVYAIDAALAIGMPQMLNRLKAMTEHPLEIVRHRAQRILTVSENMKTLEAYKFSLNTQRKIRSFLLNHTQNEGQKLKQFFKLDKSITSEWIEAFSLCRDSFSESYVLDCMITDNYQKNFVLFLDGLYGCSYQETLARRNLIKCLRASSHRALLHDYLLAKFKQLESTNFNIWTAREIKNSIVNKDFQNFLHTLFVDAWINVKDEKLAPVLDTIGELEKLSDQDLEILISVHLENLKSSRYFELWRRMLLKS